jgi:4-hydroxybenzoyl-CoA reductase subunit beta
MILFDFDYERADTLEDAVALLARLQGDARALAGGTDLLPSMRMENIKPGLLVSLSRIEPGEPQVLADGSVRIDALSRLATLENSSLLRSKVPMLAQSAHVVGGNQIRQMGTLGGNLCQEIRCLYLDQKHDYQFVSPCYKRGGECCYPFPRNPRDTCWSVYMSDIAPALIALDAQVEILGETGSRRIRVEELFTGDGLKPLKLGHAELLRAVFIPPPRRGFAWGFHKSTVRGGLEFGMAVIAVALQLAEDGMTCTDARLVIGAVREGPVRAAAAERSLKGAVLDEARLAQAAAEASREVNPLPHHGFTKRHLMDNIRVYLRRTMTQALERAGSSGADNNAVA